MSLLPTLAAHHLLVIALLGSFASAGARGTATSSPPREPQPDPAEQGERLYLAHDWAGAAAAFTAALVAHPDSAFSHFRLGTALLYLDRGAEGLGHLDQAERLGWQLPQVAFRKACARALAGGLDAAFGELDRALAAGFANPTLLDVEPLLASLRADPRWTGVRDAADRAAFPCRHDPRYRQFDFWIGEWDVRPAGAPPTTPPSENIVTREFGDCVLHEHWKGTGGSAGESFNLYDASRDLWSQTWVDNSGGLHQYEGRLDERGNMVFHAELAPPPGQTARVPTRLTFFPLGPDLVRQLSEQSTDGGRSWSVVYDFLYARRGRPASAQ